ncbi:MAG TPA: hypothetical protein VMZ27_13680 [Candidatus Saccharimonadales bacterium]|nr:hypothetical protein [Candidatus Saccharimonadales bacterium]
MNKTNCLQHLRRSCKLPILLIAALAICVQSLPAAASVPKVLPPVSKPYGQSYAEWSAAYWQWLFGQPLASNAGLDTPHFDVTDGQSGRVWFLTGPFGTIERSVTIPAGTSLFVSLLNVDGSTLEEAPFYGATAADQLAIANGFADYITDLSFTVDGQSVPNMGAFRVTSPQFNFTAPSPWLFGATGGTGQATGVGYFVMLAPLSVGTHTIHYTGAFKFSDAPEDYIGVNMTYHVTVR